MSAASLACNPVIFEYANYRAFLADLYVCRKAASRAFSFRFFSRAAGFKSPNFLKLVIQGQRNLSPESIARFARALKLDRAEARYFRALVLFNQSADVEEKSDLAERLLRSRPAQAARKLRESEFRYYSEWYFVPIREYFGLGARDSRREDPEWLARQLVPPISTAQARAALEALEEIGMLERDAAGRLGPSRGNVTTDDEVASVSIARFHVEMLKRAAEAIARFAKPERELSAATVGLSPDAAARVKGLLQRYRREILEIAAQDLGVADRVYQVGFQMFPLTVETEPEGSPESPL